MVENKLKRAEKRINRLSERYNKYIEHLDYFRNQVKKSENIKNRDICPCCDHKITSEEREILMKNGIEAKRKVEIIEAWIQQNYHCFKLFKIREPITEIKEKQQKEWKQKIENYIIKNKNKLNRAIRLFELPKDITSINEKELWNKAIERQLDLRNITNIDENDLQFEI